MTNLIETGKLARDEAMRTLAQQRARLDEGCEDARCRACGRPRQTAAQCEHFQICDWPVTRLLDESEDSSGGMAD